MLSRSNAGKNPPYPMMLKIISRAYSSIPLDGVKIFVTNSLANITTDFDTR